MQHPRRVLSCGVALLLGIACGRAFAVTPSYEYFFTAIHDSYKAYLDTANVTTDGAGYLLVSVKLDTFSAPFRDWLKKNFPGGETAEHAIDPYSVDCTNKTVGEHRLVFYDKDGFPLTDYDFGGKMSLPIADSMKDHLMHKVCGF